MSPANDDSETTNETGRNGNIQKTNRLVKAKTYKQGWNNDLLALSKFVKEQVFYVVVHDFKNDSDDPLDVNHGAICQHLYLKKFPSKVTNIHMKRATKEEMTVYLKDLWSTALNTKGKGNIRRELSSEKSAVYAAINEAFRNKKIPVPAYETFFNKKKLPRRYFIFFDVLYQAGRHNKQLWKVVTELNKGDNMIPYGSCIFEAHVMTTIQENYYKWLFMLLSDVDEVKEEYFEEQFKMEYEYDDMETNKLPKDLIDYHESNNRMTKDVEIYFDENEQDKSRLFKVFAGEDREPFRDAERCELEMLIEEVREKHQHMMELMKRKVRNIRAIKNGARINGMTDDDIKKLISAEKKKLIQFRTNDHCTTPENKKRRTSNDHRSRCSDLKVQCFQGTKEMLDREEEEGLITSWERVYKHVMNNYMVEHIDMEPVMGEPSKMLTEFNKVVDLEEIMAQAGKENAVNQNDLQARSWTAL